MGGQELQEACAREVLQDFADWGEFTCEGDCTGEGEWASEAKPSERLKKLLCGPNCPPYGFMEIHQTRQKL